MNNPKYIVIHHSLTADGTAKEWAAIRKYHMETLGFKDIGYHYGIERLGDGYVVCIGRPEWDFGAHTRECEMNKKSIGICVVGNYDEAPPEAEKIAMLKTIVLRLMEDYKIIADNVKGHREIGEMAGYDWRKGQYKTCPGRKFDMGEFRNALRDVVYTR